ncbi:hypothetical protein [Streptomyces sp. ODS28]|uniref:hypothetical protein n=1 Tax=Streptomyces sp. ODS28 TaxID=3136688 RepID=UPI0031F0FD6A
MESSDTVPVGEAAPVGAAPQASPTSDSGGGGLAEALCADLSTVLSTPVTPVDLTPRHDGAAAPLLGLIGLAEAGRCQVACRLLAEWVRADTVQRGEEPELWGPSQVEIATLLARGQRLLAGLRLIPLPAGLPPHRALEDLLPTVAELLGAMRRVALVEHAQAVCVPGWSARLRLLAERDALGRAEQATADPGGWVIAAHGLAASAFVPDAAEGSVWSQLMAVIQDQALRALADLGEAQEGEGELDRRGSADFSTLVDMEGSATLDEHPTRTGNVLQIVRLPRRYAGRVEKALVLLAPRSGG